MLLPVRLFQRKPDTQKWDYGHVLVLAGSIRYPGCAVLCAEAAMRSGAGLVTLGVPFKLRHVFAGRVKETTICPLPDTSDETLAFEALKDVMGLLKKVNACVLGPGLSQNASTQRLVHSIVRNVRLPLVIDADGLNAISKQMSVLRNIKNAMVFTPHSKEMSRLTGLSVDFIERNRKKVAKDFALRYNITLVLKGHETIVASPECGCYVNTTGNPGMATAASGDVLSGMIAAFLAQGLKTFEAARLAVYAHGMAGDLAAKDKTQISLIASDIIEYLPQTFKQLSKNNLPK